MTISPASWVSCKVTNPKTQSGQFRLDVTDQTGTSAYNVAMLLLASPVTFLNGLIQMQSIRTLPTLPRLISRFFPLQGKAKSGFSNWIHLLVRGGPANLTHHQKPSKPRMWVNFVSQSGAVIRGQLNALIDFVCLLSSKPASFTSWDNSSNAGQLLHLAEDQW